MSNYFKNLADLARGVDNDIQKLVKTWEKPHLLMSGYGAAVEDASPHVERFFGELKNVQDQLIEDRESRVKYIANTDEKIASVEHFYQNIKEQCDDIESLLSDYGYKPLHESDCPPENESEVENSILTESQMDHSQSPFSSALNDQRQTDSMYTPRINLNQPRSIATPVITSLASVMRPIQNGRTGP